jgi:tetratricopeptide (TPR) repeat protein
MIRFRYSSNLAEGDIRRRKFLTSAAYCIAAAALPLGAAQAAQYERRVAAAGRRAGATEIDVVRDMTAMFTAIDERYGGQHGRAAVVQYLTSDVTYLCRASFGSQADKAAMLSSAAEVAYLCGWKANDAGESGLAQRYYLQAFALTREAADDPHQAFILRIMAHNGMDLRRPESTLDLAEAALARVRGHVDPAAEAIFSVTVARALAHAGRSREAVTQLRQAHDLVLHGDEQALPHWAGLWGSARACVNSHTAKTLNRVGDHAAAERYYGAAARARPGADQQRITGLELAAQGDEQAAQGHVEHACVTWGRALTSLDGVRSARAARAVSRMRRSVGPWLRRGVRTAADLDERARFWLAGT